MVVFEGRWRRGGQPVLPWYVPATGARPSRRRVLAGLASVSLGTTLGGCSLTRLRSDRSAPVPVSTSEPVRGRPTERPTLVSTVVSPLSAPTVLPPTSTPTPSPRTLALLTTRTDSPWLGAINAAANLMT